MSDDYGDVAPEVVLCFCHLLRRSSPPVYRQRYPCSTEVGWHLPERITRPPGAGLSLAKPGFPVFQSCQRTARRWGCGGFGRALACPRMNPVRAASRWLHPRAVGLKSVAGQIGALRYRTGLLDSRVVARDLFRSLLARSTYSWISAICGKTQLQGLFPEICR